MRTRLMLALVGSIFVVGLGLLWGANAHKQQEPPNGAFQRDTRQSALTTIPAAETGGVASSRIARVDKVGVYHPLAASAEVNDRIEVLAANKTTYPPFEVASAFCTNDEAALVALYVSETELTNKRALTWTLMAVGREKAAQVLLQTVRLDRHGGQLTLHEWEVMRDTILALGVVAAYSQEAYDFLRDASSEGYWEKNRTWRAWKPGLETYIDGCYAGLAIQALGASLRPEVPSIVAEAKSQSDLGHFEAFGSIADAEFYYDFGTEKGREALIEMFLKGSTVNELMRWYQSEPGASWRDWFYRKSKVTH